MTNPGQNVHCALMDHGCFKEWTHRTCWVVAPSYSLCCCGRRTHCSTLPFWSLIAFTWDSVVECLFRSFYFSRTTHSWLHISVMMTGSLNLHILQTFSLSGTNSTVLCKATIHMLSSYPERKAFLNRTYYTTKCECD